MATGPDVTTAEALLRLPRGRWRYELVKGQLRTMTPAGHLHGRVAARVLVRLATYVDRHQLGVTYAAETGFILSRKPDTVRAPDASFVSQARFAAFPQNSRGYFLGPPDLAIEVVSPDDSYPELEQKAGDWLRAGCGAVVILDPETESAAIHVSEGRVDHVRLDEDLAVPEVLPGWSVSLRDLFA